MTVSRAFIFFLPFLFFAASCGEENVNLISDGFITPDQDTTLTLTSVVIAENFRNDSVLTFTSLLGRQPLPDGRLFQATTYLKFSSRFDENNDGEIDSLGDAVSVSLLLERTSTDSTFSTSKSVAFDIRRASTQWRSGDVYSRTTFVLNEVLATNIALPIGVATSQRIALPKFYADSIIAEVKRYRSIETLDSPIDSLIRYTAQSLAFTPTNSADTLASLLPFNPKLEITYNAVFDNGLIERRIVQMNLQDQSYTVQTSPDAVSNDALYFTSSTGDWTKLEFSSFSFPRNARLISAQLLLVRDTLFVPRSSADIFTQVQSRFQFSISVLNAVGNKNSDYGSATAILSDSTAIEIHRANVTAILQRAISLGEKVTFVLSPSPNRDVGFAQSWRVFGSNESDVSRRPRLVITYFKN